MKYLAFFILTFVFFIMGCKEKKQSVITYKWEAYSQVYEDTGNVHILPPLSKYDEGRVILTQEPFRFEVSFNLIIKMINKSDDTVKYIFSNVCQFYHEINGKKIPIIYDRKELSHIAPHDSLTPILRSKLPTFLTKEFRFIGKRVTINEYLRQKNAIHDSVNKVCDSLVKNSKIVIVMCDDSNNTKKLTLKYLTDITQL